jgi:hypothetical protein
MTTGQKQPKATMPAVLDPLVHLRRIGSGGPWGSDAPSGIGDLTFSAALALRFDHGTLLATVRVWNTLNHVEYEIPIEWDGSTAVKTTLPNGALVYKRNLGPMPGMGTSGWYGGLFYDAPTGLYFSNRQGNYDTSGDVMTCSLVGHESNGKLVGDKQLKFSIGDKRVSNICRIPQWFADDYLGGGDWYCVCGGGGASAVNTGNVSLMPSVCAFRLPEGSGVQTAECLELQGCQYSAYRSESTRQETLNMQWQEFGDTEPPFVNGWPGQPYLTGAPGLWSWAHLVWAGMTWVDAPGVSGPMFYLCEPCQTTAQLNAGTPGCEFYGHNDGSPNPCQGNAGAKACLNTSAKRPVMYVTDWHDLAEVAQGQRDPCTVQSTRVEFPIPNILIPAKGWPNTDRDGVGCATAYDETRQAWIYGLMINGGQKPDGTTNTWPTIQVYQVEAPEEPEPPEPTPEPPDEETTMVILDAEGVEVATVTVKPPYTFG